MSVLHDKDIREPLFDYLEDIYGKVRIIEEKTVGKSRADIVMVTETDLCGIEIKSDADTYARLSSQVKDYDKYFDRNIVVVGSSHGAHISEHVPGHWGIITVEELNNSLDFYFLRKPQSNPKPVLKKKIEILWRPELAILQLWNGMPKYERESKKFVIRKILVLIENGKIDSQLISEQISQLLFERDYTRISEELEEYRNSKRRGILRSQ